MSSKRLLALLLVFAMTISSVVPAYAANEDPIYRPEVAVEEINDSLVLNSVTKQVYPVSTITNAVNPDEIVPDSNVPDEVVPESNVPDEIVPDSNVPDEVIPESNVPDEIVPDSNIPDEIVPDSNVPDEIVPLEISPNSVITDKLQEELAKAIARAKAELIGELNSIFGTSLNPDADYDSLEAALVPEIERMAFENETAIIGRLEALQAVINSIDRLTVLDLGKVNRLLDKLIDCVKIKAANHADTLTKTVTLSFPGVQDVNVWYQFGEDWTDTGKWSDAATLVLPGTGIYTFVVRSDNDWRNNDYWMHGAFVDDTLNQVIAFPVKQVTVSGILDTTTLAIKASDAWVDYIYDRLPGDVVVFNYLRNEDTYLIARPAAFGMGSENDYKIDLNFDSEGKAVVDLSSHCYNIVVPNGLSEVNLRFGNGAWYKNVNYTAGDNIVVYKSGASVELWFNLQSKTYSPIVKLDGSDPFNGMFILNFPGIEGATMHHYKGSWATVSGTFDNSALFTAPGATSVRAAKGGMSVQIDGLGKVAYPYVIDIPVGTITVTDIGFDCNLSIVGSDWVYQTVPSSAGEKTFNVFGGRTYELRISKEGFHTISLPGLEYNATVDAGEYFYKTTIPAGVTSIQMQSNNWIVNQNKPANPDGSIDLLKTGKTANVKFVMDTTTYNVDFTLDGDPNSPWWVKMMADPTCSLEGYVADWNLLSDWKGNYEYEPALGHLYDEAIWDGFGWYIVCEREECGWAGYLSYDPNDPNFIKVGEEISGNRTILLPKTVDGEPIMSWAATKEYDYNKLTTLIKGFNLYYTNGQGGAIIGEPIDSVPLSEGGMIFFSNLEDGWYAVEEELTDIGKAMFEEASLAYAGIVNGVQVGGNVAFDYGALYTIINGYGQGYTLGYPNLNNGGDIFSIAVKNDETGEVYPSFCANAGSMNFAGDNELDCRGYYISGQLNKELPNYGDFLSAYNYIQDKYGDLDSNRAITQVVTWVLLGAININAPEFDAIEDWKLDKAAVRDVIANSVNYIGEGTIVDLVFMVCEIPDHSYITCQPQLVPLYGNRGFDNKTQRVALGDAEFVKEVFVAGKARPATMNEFVFDLFKIEENVEPMFIGEYATDINGLVRASDLAPGEYVFVEHVSEQRMFNNYPDGLGFELIDVGSDKTQVVWKTSGPFDLEERPLVQNKYKGNIEIEKLVDGIGIVTQFDGEMSRINELIKGFNLYKVAGEGAPFADLDLLAEAQLNEHGKITFTSLPDGWYAVEEVLTEAGTKVFEQVPAVYLHIVNGVQYGGNNTFDYDALYWLTFDLSKNINLGIPGLHQNGEVFPITVSNTQTGKDYPSFCASGTSRLFAGHNNLGCEGYIVASIPSDHNLNSFLQAYSYIEDTIGPLNDNRIVTQVVTWALLGNVDVQSSEFETSGLTQIEKDAIKVVMANYAGYQSKGKIVDLVYMICKTHEYNDLDCQPQLVPIYAESTFENKKINLGNVEFDKDVLALDARRPAEKDEFSFDLFKIDTEGERVIVGTYETNADGKVSVEGLALGKYVFVEVPKVGWEQTTYIDGLYFNLIETSSHQAEVEWLTQGPINEAGNPIVTNCPTGEIVIEKTVDGEINIITYFDGDMAKIKELIAGFNLYKVTGDKAPLDGSAVKIVSMAQVDEYGMLTFSELLDGWYAIEEVLTEAGKDFFEQTPLVYIQIVNSVPYGSSVSFDYDALYTVNFTTNGKRDLNYPGLHLGGEIFYIGVRHAITGDEYVSFCAHANSERFAGDNDLDCTGYLVAARFMANEPYAQDYAKFVAAYNYIEDVYGSLNDNRIITQVVTWVLLGAIDTGSDNFANANLSDDEKARVCEIIEKSVEHQGNGKIVDLVYMLCEDPDHDFTQCQPQLVPIYGESGFNNKTLRYGDVEFAKEVLGLNENRHAEVGEFSFKLYKIVGEDDWKEIGIFTTDAEGIVKATDLTPGRYVFVEQEHIPQMFNNIPDGLKFSLIDDGTSNLRVDWETGIPFDSSERPIVLNEYVGDVEFDKDVLVLGETRHANLDEFSFELYKVVAEGDPELIGIFPTNAEGKVRVEGLALGRYFFKEVPKAGWKSNISEDGLFFELKENASHQVEVVWEWEDPINEAGNPIVTNCPTGEIVIEKTVDGEINIVAYFDGNMEKISELIKGFNLYKLTKNSDLIKDLTPLRELEQLDENGMLIFTDLPDGVYVVEEVLTEAGKQVFKQVSPVTISIVNGARYEGKLNNVTILYGDVEFDKDVLVLGETRHANLDEFSFELYKVVAEGDPELIDVFPTNAEGKVRVEDLALGRYFFKEVPKAGWKSNIGEDGLFFELKENASHQVEVVWEWEGPRNEDGNPIVTNCPTGEIVIEKTVDGEINIVTYFDGDMEKISELIKGFNLYKLTKNSDLIKDLIPLRELAQLDENGMLSFKDLPDGVYVVEEVLTEAGKLVFKQVSPVTISIVNGARYEGKLNNVTILYGDVEFDKDVLVLGETRHANLDEFSFELYKVVAEGDPELIGAIPTNAEGKVRVEGLDLGRYFFKEVPKTGWKSNIGEDGLFFELKENESHQVEVVWEWDGPINEDGNPIVTNCPTGEIVIEKTVDGEINIITYFDGDMEKISELIKGFNLYKLNANSDLIKDLIPLRELAQLDENGMLSFKDLPDGVYVVEEVLTEAGKQVFKQVSPVTISIVNGARYEGKLNNITILYGDVEFDKNVLVLGETRPANLDEFSFELYKVVAEGDPELIGVFPTNAEGKVRVEGLALGRYFFKEVPKAGWKSNIGEDGLFFELKENASHQVEVVWEWEDPVNDDGNPVVTNCPTGRIEIEKLVNGIGIEAFFEENPGMIVKLIEGFEIYKVDADGAPLEGLEPFRTVQLEEGKIIVTDLPDGWYAVKEVLSADGEEYFEPVQPVYIYIENGAQQDDKEFLNVRDIRGNVEFDKETLVFDVHNPALEGQFSFDLFKIVGEDQKEKVATYSTNADGKIVVTDLALGSYVFIEVPKVGWEQTTYIDGLYFNLVETSSHQAEVVWLSQGPINEAGNPVVTNCPTGRIEIEKLVNGIGIEVFFEENPGMPIKLIEGFEIYKVDADGASLEGLEPFRTVQLEEGKIIVTDLPDGWYAVKEVLTDEGKMYFEQAPVVYLYIQNSIQFGSSATFDYKALYTIVNGYGDRYIKTLGHPGLNNEGDIFYIGVTNTITGKEYPSFCAHALSKNFAGDNTLGCKGYMVAARNMPNEPNSLGYEAFLAAYNYIEDTYGSLNDNRVITQVVTWVLLGAIDVGSTDFAEANLTSDEAHDIKDVIANYSKHQSKGTIVDLVYMICENHEHDFTYCQPQLVPVYDKGGFNNTFIRGNVEFKKEVYGPEENRAAGNGEFTFDLYKIVSQDQHVLIATLKTDDNGVVKATDLAPGEYVFIEQEHIPQMFNNIPDGLKFALTNDGTGKAKVVWETEIPFDLSDRPVVVNEYFGDVEFDKDVLVLGETRHANLDEFSFELYKVVAESDPQLIDVFRTNAEGKVRVEDLALGRYFFKEVPKAGWKSNIGEDGLFFELKENASHQVEVVWEWEEPINEAGNPIVTNCPTGEILIEKTVDGEINIVAYFDGNMEKISELIAGFNLYKLTKNSDLIKDLEPIVALAHLNEEGKLSFTELPDGHYVIEEVLTEAGKEYFEQLQPVHINIVNGVRIGDDKLENTTILYGDVEFDKVALELGVERPANEGEFSFELYKIVAEGDPELIDVFPTNADGKVRVEGLGLGSYVFVEVEKVGWTSDIGDGLYFDMIDNGEHQVEVVWKWEGSRNEAGNPIVTNCPTGEILIEKTVDGEINIVAYFDGNMEKISELIKGFNLYKLTKNSDLIKDLTPLRELEQLDENGMLIFTDLPDGVYVVEEVLTEAGKLIFKQVSPVTISIVNGARYEGKLNNVTILYGDVEFDKDVLVLGETRHANLDEFSFELYKVVAEGDPELIGVIPTNADGKVRVEDLALGRYFFKEVPKTGWKSNIVEDGLFFELKENESHQVEVVWEWEGSRNEDGNPIVTNCPTGEIVIEKTVDGEINIVSYFDGNMDKISELIKGFNLYKLTKNSDLIKDLIPLRELAQLDENGMLSFKDLPDGVYVVEEVLTEAGKQVFKQVSPVTISIVNGARYEGKLNNVTILYGDVEFDKNVLVLGETRHANLDEFSFELYKVVAEGDPELIGIIPTNAEGKVRVEGLDLGRYFFKEVPKAGWKSNISEDGLFFELKENASHQVEVVWEWEDPINEAGNPIVTNCPTGEILIEKTVDGEINIVTYFDGDLTKISELIAGFNLYKVTGDKAPLDGSAVKLISLAQVNEHGVLVFSELLDGWYAIEEVLTEAGKDFFEQTPLVYIQIVNSVPYGSSISFDYSAFYVVNYNTSGMRRINYTGLNQGGEIFYIGVRNTLTNEEYTSFCAHGGSTHFAGHENGLDCTGYLVAARFMANEPSAQEYAKFVAAYNYIEDTYGELKNNRFVTQVITWILLGYVDVDSPEYAATNLTLDERNMISEVLKNYADHQGEGKIVDLVYMLCENPEHDFSKCQPQLVPIYGERGINNKTAIHGSVEFDKEALILDESRHAEENEFAFNLFKIDADNERVSVGTYVTNGDGKVIVEGLALGEYVFEEVAEAGWKPITYIDGLHFKLIDDGTRHAQVVWLSDGPINEDGNPIVTNCPTGEIVIEKTVDGEINIVTYFDGDMAKISELIKGFNLYKVTGDKAPLDGSAVKITSLAQVNEHGMLTFSELLDGWYAIEEVLTDAGKGYFEQAPVVYIQIVNTVPYGSSVSFDYDALYKVNYTTENKRILNYPELNQGGEIFYIGVRNALTNEEYTSFCAHGGSTHFAGDNDLDCTGYRVAARFMANEPNAQKYATFVAAYNYIEDVFGSLEKNRVLTQVVTWVLLGAVDIESDAFGKTNLSDDEKAWVREIIEKSVDHQGKGKIVDLVYMLCEDSNHDYTLCQPQLVPIYGERGINNKTLKNGGQLIVSANATLVKTIRQLREIWQGETTPHQYLSKKYNSVTATTQNQIENMNKPGNIDPRTGKFTSNAMVVVSNSNHFAYTKLKVSDLNKGVSLVLVEGNKINKVGSATIKQDGSNLVITINDFNNGQYGAMAFKNLPHPGNGNIHSAKEKDLTGWGGTTKKFEQKFTTATATIPMPETKGEYIYLYIHGNFQFDVTNKKDPNYRDGYIWVDTPAKLVRLEGFDPVSNITSLDVFVKVFDSNNRQVEEFTLNGNNVTTGVKTLSLPAGTYTIEWVFDYEGDTEVHKGAIEVKPDETVRFEHISATFSKETVIETLTSQIYLDPKRNPTVIHNAE